MEAYITTLGLLTRVDIFASFFCSLDLLCRTLPNISEKQVDL